jgi:hypothetical protein
VTGKLTIGSMTHLDIRFAMPAVLPTGSVGRTRGGARRTERGLRGAWLSPSAGRSAYSFNWTVRGTSGCRRGRAGTGPPSPASPGRPRRPGRWVGGALGEDRSYIGDQLGEPGGRRAGHQAGGEGGQDPAGVERSQVGGEDEHDGAQRAEGEGRDQHRLPAGLVEHSSRQEQGGQDPGGQDPGGVDGEDHRRDPRGEMPPSLVDDVEGGGEIGTFVLAGPGRGVRGWRTSPAASRWRSRLGDAAVRAVGPGSDCRRPLHSRSQPRLPAGNAAGNAGSDELALHAPRRRLPDLVHRPDRVLLRLRSPVRADEAVGLDGPIAWPRPWSPRSWSSSP